VRFAGTVESEAQASLRDLPARKSSVARSDAEDVKSRKHDFENHKMIQLFGRCCLTSKDSPREAITDESFGAVSGSGPDKSRYRVRREKAVVHSGGKPARELVRSTR
jgi:hypothetical protein